MPLTFAQPLAQPLHPRTRTLTNAGLGEREILVLTPVAKAKLKKLLRHVGASGWDAAQHHLPFLHHAKSLPAGVTQDDHGASSPEAFPTSGNVAFSSRSGVGISSPKPPRREESFKYSPYM